jgi:lysylphosphatidylglycerol synthetase-like protein (DUF2156 family)
MIERQCSCSAVLIVVLGCILASMSAFVPHYNNGYLLMISVLLAGISPYLVYAIAIPYLSSSLLIITGLLLIVAHGWLVFTYRYAQPVDYSDHWIYYGPLLLAVAVLPLVYCAMRVPYAGHVEPKADTQSGSGQGDTSSTRH